MTEAKVEERFERVVTGPKPIHALNEKGERYVANIGDTVSLNARQCKTFARYVTAPEVAAAQAKVKQAEEDSFTPPLQRPPGAEKPVPKPPVSPKAPGAGS